MEGGEANGVKSLGSSSRYNAGAGEARQPDDQQVVGPYGPSGGRNGLNTNVGCTICGSTMHFTWKCDNVKAREAQVGRCTRCGEAGHTRASCQERRCLRCGEVGHEENECAAPANQVLNAVQRREVERQETEHERVLERKLAMQRERQVGEHGGKIPEVKSSGDGKRKREVGVDEARKEMRKDKWADEKAGAGAGVGVSMPGAPTGPAAGVPTKPRPIGIGGTAAATARPSGQAPLIKKKKASEASLFARKR